MEALQITEERRDVKSKGKRERRTELNAEFQRIAWRDKKTFFNEQYKENLRMYSNIKQQISKMQNRNYFCTNPIKFGLELTAT